MGPRCPCSLSRGSASCDVLFLGHCGARQLWGPLLKPQAGGFEQRGFDGHGCQVRKASKGEDKARGRREARWATCISSGVGCCLGTGLGRRRWSCELDLQQRKEQEAAVCSSRRLSGSGHSSPPVPAQPPRSPLRQQCVSRRVKPRWGIRT